MNKQKASVFIIYVNSSYFKILSVNNMETANT